METLLTFAEALAALKEGKPVARVGWNGKGMFAFKQVHADIPMEVVPGMQSVPQAVKDIFVSRHERGITRSPLHTFDPIYLNTIRYRNQFCIVYPDNTIYAWVPSANDICNDDWIILDYDKLGV